jgi:outer membrane biosynthesis protein TonB
MRTLLLVAAIALLGTSAHAGTTRGLALASTTSASAAAPAAPAASAAQTAPVAGAPPAATPQALAKPDKAEKIIEQLVKHGVIKVPPQAAPAAGPANATVAPAPAAVTAPAPQAAPVAAASAQPAPVAQPAPAVATATPMAKVSVDTPKTMGGTESRIRAELRRHGIR